MLDELLLLSGVDIPFPQAQIVIHQPKIKEISMIGEETFFLGCEVLNLSKNLLTAKDKSDLENKTNFDILIAIINETRNQNIQKSRISVMMILTLLFPNFKIKFDKSNIILIEESEKEVIHKINNDNFEDFKGIIVKMFCLKEHNGDLPVYNPGGSMAAEIAAKLNKGRALAAQAKGENDKKVSIISRYMSVLSIGNHLSLESINNYTIYQLFDSYKRFQKKYDFDIYIKAKMAGAQNLKEVENWMEDIHSESKDFKGDIR